MDMRLCFFFSWVLSMEGKEEHQKFRLSLNAFLLACVARLATRRGKKYIESTMPLSEAGKSEKKTHLSLHLPPPFLQSSYSSSLLSLSHHPPLILSLFNLGTLLLHHKP
jgi:hypothetical protein